MTRSPPAALPSRLAHTLLHPLFWTLCALLLLALFALFHLLQWRDATSIISGTLAPSDPSLLHGILYAAAWFAALLLAPILLLAAALHPFLHRLFAPTKQVAPSPAASSKTA